MLLHNKKTGQDKEYKFYSKMTEDKKFQLVVYEVSDGDTHEVHIYDNLAGLVADFEDVKE